jgi:hypothetical protein
MLSQEAKEEFGEYFGINFDMPEKKKLKKNKNKDLVIADIHVPYHNVKAFDKTINSNLDCENLYIIGDWFDFYSKSRFRHTKSVNFRDEFRKGFNLLKTLSDKFEKIYFILANHDGRFEKWLYDNVHPEVLEFCDTKIVENILTCIPNLKILSQPVNSHREIGYVVQVKNVIFTHIEKSNIDITKPVQEINKYLYKWENTFNLNNFDGIIQAHNHSSGKVRLGDKFLFQIPCLIDISSFAFDYVFSGKAIGNPPALGYIVLIKDKENPNKYDLKKTVITDL